MTKQEDYAIDEPDYISQLNGNLDWLMEDYSQYLHDGDYEKYQPYTNNQGKNIDLNVLYYVEQELSRLYWIKNRFTQRGSEQWDILQKAFELARNRMKFIQETMDGKGPLNFNQHFSKRCLPWLSITVPVTATILLDTLEHTATAARTLQ